MPWKRLVSTEFLRKAGQQGRMVFLKDTCCDYELVRERQAAVERHPLKIFKRPTPSPGSTACATAPPVTAA